jgi:hypothetical protein
MHGGTTIVHGASRAASQVATQGCDRRLMSPSHLRSRRACLRDGCRRPATIAVTGRRATTRETVGRTRAVTKTSTERYHWCTSLRQPGTCQSAGTSIANRRFVTMLDPPLIAGGSHRPSPGPGTRRDRCVRSRTEPLHRGFKPSSTPTLSLADQLVAANLNRFDAQSTNPTWRHVAARGCRGRPDPRRPSPSPRAGRVLCASSARS